MEKLKYKIEVLGPAAEDENQINFLPMKGGAYQREGGLFERGRLIEDLR